MSQETIWERSFGNGASLLSLLMKLYALISNYKDESVNHRYPAEWISFHVPGSSGGRDHSVCDRHYGPRQHLKDGVSSFSLSLLPFLRHLKDYGMP